MGLDQLDDDDFPSYTVGQASEVLGVQPAFLRSLDAAGVISPGRSDGGHRRYSRRQLVLAARVQELFNQGHSMASAKQVLGLEADLRKVQDERDRVQVQRDEARDQRDQAYQQRDEARDQRDQAYQQRDEAREEVIRPEVTALRSGNSSAKRECRDLRPCRDLADRGGQRPAL